MGFHRADGDIESLGNLGITATRNNQIENF
jgi:hypothetical protein